MIAADLPDGSVVARPDVAFIKGGDVWWSSGVREPYDSIIVQDAIDAGLATVLRVGSETDETGWQWGARAEYRDGDPIVYDHTGEYAARDDVAGLEGERSVTRADLVRRWRAVGAWRPYVDPETGATDGG